MVSYCYRFKDINNNIIYVGKTVDINKRMAQHFGGKGHLDKDCYKSVAVIEYHYQVLKKQVEKSPASWGCLTYILIIALIYAIFQLIA